MKTIMILDTETSSLDAMTGHLLEVGMAVYSVEHRALVRARSWLVYAESNEAIAVNGIPTQILKYGVEEDAVQHQIGTIFAKECEAIVAHSAKFDRQWFTPEIQRLPWICSCDDIEWNRRSGSQSLAALALAHGVGVAAAHRALDDVMTLVRIFDRAAELGADVSAMLDEAARPRPRFISLASYDDRELVKSHGFRWDRDSREWWKKMTAEESLRLPFAVREECG